MKKEKVATLTLENAKLMYTSDIAELKEFALRYYTKEELTKKEFPKSWKDLKIIQGCFLGFESEIIGVQKLPAIDENKCVFPNRNLVNASLALAQLLQLRNKWWEIDDNWKPIWEVNSDKKFTIIVKCNELEEGYSISTNKIFAFRTQEIRNAFLVAFEDLLKQATPLL